MWYDGSGLGSPARDRDAITFDDPAPTGMVEAIDMLSKAVGTCGIPM